MNTEQGENPSPERDRAGSASEELKFYGGPLFSLFPLLFFVVWAIVQSAILRIGNAEGLVVGMLVGIILGMFFAKGDWKHYANTLFEGMTQKVVATCIVAWLWAGMFAETLQVGGFVDGLIWLGGNLGVGGQLFPVLSFLLSAIFATGVGTGYGTTIAFCTLFFPTGIILGADPVLVFASILSGAIFGDNLAPVSDTTIVSAVTQESDIGGVVASRLKYAIVAATGAIVLFLVFAAGAPGPELGINVDQFISEYSKPAGLVHLLSMGIVIFMAVLGRHIVEAISWGIIAAVVFNVSLGLSKFSGIFVFKVPEEVGFAESISFLPFIQIAQEAGIGGSLYEGPAGFFTMIVLILLIVGAAQLMMNGGGFETIQKWLLRTCATTVRGGELTMVLGTAMINGMITINTAAEIAIAPFISETGRRFNINGYRRANILDANTSALGYIFPWSGGVLVGYEVIRNLPGEYEWFEPSFVVQPIEVFPYVFHGWLLVAVFIIAAMTGFGREYTSDRVSNTASRV